MSDSSADDLKPETQVWLDMIRLLRHICRHSSPEAPLCAESKQYIYEEASQAMDLALAQLENLDGVR